MEKQKIRIQKQGPEYGIPRSIKFASEKYKLEHNTDTNKQFWEKGWISSLQRDNNVATKSGLELCCVSFNEHVSKSCNNKTCSLAEREITEKGRVELVFPTNLEKQIEEHKLWGKDKQFLAVTNNRNEQSPVKEMISNMEEKKKGKRWTGKYQPINLAASADEKHEKANKCKYETFTCVGVEITKVGNSSMADPQIGADGSLKREREV